MNIKISGLKKKPDLHDTPEGAVTPLKQEWEAGIEVYWDKDIHAHLEEPTEKLPHMRGSLAELCSQPAYTGELIRISVCQQKGSSYHFIKLEFSSIQFLFRKKKSWQENVTIMPQLPVRKKCKMRQKA